jgi:serine/threonine-protein kinase HipA
MTAAPRYAPQDSMFLWYLGAPAQPVPVGTLRLVRSLRGVSLQYNAAWIEHGFALSEDLPLIDQEFLPNEKDGAAGAVDDARPDRWGERVIRLIHKPERLSLLEYLYFTGDDRFGALGVSLQAQHYEPHPAGALPTLADAQAIQNLVRRVLANEPVPAAQRRLIAPGGTMGGALPKALVAIDGETWVVKFSDGAPTDQPLIEHASMTLAAKAGIRVAATRPIRLDDGHCVAVRRFDRSSGRHIGRRLHAQSAHVALRAAGEPYGYPELAQLLRRRGAMAGGVAARQMRELFRRMVFNILIDNTDDHEKNHALLLDDSQHFELAPAFDVLPSGQGLGYQQMRVGLHEADSTLDNAMSMCGQFGLSEGDAAREVRAVVKSIDRWADHFAACGVRQRDIEAQAEQIDRPFLREQRQAFKR